MKKTTLYVLMLTVLTCISCSKDEFIFSCDKNADKWVKNNLSEIQAMTRSEWQEINNSAYKQAAYRGFSSNQKLSLWTAKLEDAIRLDWNEEECEHIKLLISIINNNLHWFDSHQNESVIDEISLFAYKWTEYAMDNFGWSQKTIAFMTSTPEAIGMDKEKSLFILEVLSTDNTIKTRSEAVSCDCYTNAPTWATTCGTGFWPEVCKGDCVPTNGGCGFVWVYDCDGICTRGWL